MRIAVDTPFGRRQYAIRNLRDVRRHLRELQATSEGDLRAGLAPYSWDSTARYKREGIVSGGKLIKPVREDWKRAARIEEEQNGDCEDWATYEAASLVVSGVDPGARAEPYIPRPGLVHVVTVGSDGTVTDPSRAHGMGALGMEADRIQWKARRTARGAEAALKIPFVADDGEVGAVIARAKARTMRGAIRKATFRGVGALRTVGALPAACGSGCAGCGKCSCGGCKIGEIGADPTIPGIQEELGELAANVRAGNTAGAVESLKRAATTAGAAAGGGGVNWEDVAKKAVTAGCAIGLAASGVASWAAPACALIGPIWDQIKKWMTVKIDPHKDFIAAAKIEIPDLLDKGSYKRYYLAYVAKDKAELDRKIADRAADGWQPAFKWEKSYGSSYQWGSGKGTYYGAVWNRESAPQAARDKWQIGGATYIRRLMLPQAELAAEMQAEARAKGGVAIPSLPLDFAGPEDLTRYREVAIANNIVIPATAAPDSIIMTNDGYKPLRDLFSTPGAAPSAPAAPASATYQPPTGGGESKGTIPERQAALTAALRAPTPAAAPAARLPDRVSAQFANLRSAVAMAQDNDWKALQRFAQVIERNDPRSPIGKLARMLVRR